MTNKRGNIHVGDIRQPALGSGVYIGRQMSTHPASPLRNPLPLVGKTWSKEAQEWTKYLQTLNDPKVQAIATQAQQKRGYSTGEAGPYFMHVLRAKYQQDPEVRRTLEELAERVMKGEDITLQCWCRGADYCHGHVVKKAIEGIIRQKTH